MIPAVQRTVRELAWMCVERKPKNIKISRFENGQVFAVYEYGSGHDWRIGSCDITDIGDEAEREAWNALFQNPDEWQRLATAPRGWKPGASNE